MAFPTETVYGLGADATNEKAVSRIYSSKGRPENHPLIVHISSINQLENWVRDIPEYAIKLASTFWPGPMTLVLKRSTLAMDFITGGQDSIGIRVPDQQVALIAYGDSLPTHMVIVQNNLSEEFLNFVLLFAYSELFQMPKAETIVSVSGISPIPNSIEE